MLLVEARRDIMLTQRLFHRFSRLQSITASPPRCLVHFKRTKNYSYNPSFYSTPTAAASFITTSTLAKTSTKTAILTKDAPMPMPGIYSQGIVAGGFVFCSGTVAMDTNGNIIDGDIKDHTRQCIKNLTAVLEDAGSSIDKVVKVNIFLADMGDVSKMNEEYVKHWGDIKPCRTCIAAKTLPLNTDIEIECIAVL